MLLVVLKIPSSGSDSMNIAPTVAQCCIHPKSTFGFKKAWVVGIHNDHSSWERNKSWRNYFVAFPPRNVIMAVDVFLHAFFPVHQNDIPRSWGSYPINDGSRGV
jgi:hypothetical protein